MLSPRVRFAALCLALLAGCARKPEPPPYTVTESGTAYSANGWSAAERAEYYHLAEGSELMPYLLAANLKSIKTGKPFLENMERFGFLPDATARASGCWDRLWASKTTILGPETAPCSARPGTPRSRRRAIIRPPGWRSEEHTSEL